LEYVLREVLRMYPPLIILMRKVHEPMKFKNYEIPVGDLLCVSPGVGMRLESVYPNPDKFDPHRFERGEHLAHPFAYLAFGGGKHGCIGENFGILQIKTIWSVLFDRYDFELVNKETPQPNYKAMVVGPQAPCLIMYRRKGLKGLKGK